MTHVDTPGAETLAALSVEFATAQKTLVLVDGERHAALAEALAARAPETVAMAGVDEAIEWCEDRLLDADPTVVRAPATIALRDHLLCTDLDDASFARLQPLLGHRTFAAGELLLRRGALADEVLLIVEGQVSVTIPHPEHGFRRLATFTAGMVVGEAAFVTHAVRTADTHADLDGAAYSLSAEALAGLDAIDPAMKATLLRNLLTGAYEAFLHVSSDLGL